MQITPKWRLDGPAIDEFPRFTHKIEIDAMRGQTKLESC
jgi:hypothetical protein